jgi:hypothetical protein
METMYSDWKRLIDGWVKLICDRCVKVMRNWSDVTNFFANLTISDLKKLVAHLMFIGCMLRHGVKWSIQGLTWLEENLT